MDFKDKLEIRHNAERIFHDRKYSKENGKGTLYEMGFTAPILSRMLGMLGDLNGKKVVDFGCGSGWLSEILLRRGAEVWAFDISEEAVKRSREVGKKIGMAARIHADVMSAEAMAYEGDFFDAVVGTAILHHLDLRLAANEIHRILKKGGKAYFMEPLGHNPVINLYRRLTPWLRSSDEKPLRKNDFRCFRERFGKVDMKAYYLLSILALFWYYIVRREDLMIRTRNILFHTDELLVRALPALQKYCWYAILVLEK